ncbi:hypothetical protein N0V82_005423 [Gnomoniopsis sp. IMI 355080]|nr:hypothetical protein N0V82_005423 [Gnomoniopsis sp. IMI 355080]
MRAQFIASLALLQLCSTAAAATAANSEGSNSMVNISGNQGTSPAPSGHSDHGSKAPGGHGASMDGGKGRASSGPVSGKKGKGMPRMVDFPGIHLSPVEGGVVLPSGSATWDKRATSSAVSSPDSNLWSKYDCDLDLTIARSKRCSGFRPDDVPDPIPADCETTNTCADYGSIANGGSATIEARRIPVPSGLPGGLELSCPIIGRRGDFLIRRCPEETTGYPSWIEKEMETEPDIPAIAK